MDSDLEKAKKYCLRLLSVRPRTEREIETRLKDRGIGEDIRKDTVDLLKRDGLIDDLEFARNWIDLRLRSNPKARKVLRMELNQKGVGDDFIDRAFLEKGPQLDERAIALGIVRKKAEESGFCLTPEDKGRLFRYVVRRGFDPETAEEVIEEVLR